MQFRTKIDDADSSLSMASIDPTFSRGMRLMLSDEPDAAPQLRAMLDEALMNKYGLRLKLPEEIRAEDVHHSKCESPFGSSLKDSNQPRAANFEDSFSLHLTDLSCVVCGQFNVGVSNQLVECHGCQRLYHQDCHNPPVKDLVEANKIWNCSFCLGQYQQICHEFNGTGSETVSSAFTTLCNVLEDFYPEQSTPINSSGSGSPKSSFPCETKSHLKTKRHSSSHGSVIQYKSSRTSASSRHSR